jgi:C4-dicarboxylate transporter DctQ subunit
MKIIMNKIGRTLSLIINSLTLISEVLAEIGLLALFFLVFHEVVARYFFSKPTIFSVEISEYLMTFITFMCVGWVLKQNRHVRMTLLQSRLSKRLQAYMEIFSTLLIMLFCAVIVWKGTQSVMVAYRGSYHSSSLVNFPLWISYAFIPYGTLILGLQGMVIIGKQIQRLRDLKKTSFNEEVL